MTYNPKKRSESYFNKKKLCSDCKINRISFGATRCLSCLSSLRKRGIILSGKPFKRGHKGYRAMLGKKHTEESRKKMRISHKGVKLSIKHIESIKLANKTGHHRIPHSKESKKKMSISAKKVVRHPFSEEQRRKMGLSRRGESSHFWKGGISPINEKMRHSLDARLWREAVFKRDDWICAICKKRGGILNAHHIKSWAKHLELRYDINNGITLCIDCHKETHKKKPRNRV